VDNFVHNLEILNSSYLAINGESRSYFIQTFGCQMNENDSEKLAGTLESAGFVVAKAKKDADLIIFNTCCVRENAELKVYGHLGALKKLKDEKPDLVIAICGCMMHQPEVAEYVRKVYKHVDIVFGNTNQFKFPEMLCRVLTDKITIYQTDTDEMTIVEAESFKRKYDMKAYVTIMYGCNNFCSYCIVPYVRGRERSRTPDGIISEVNQLATDGCKEIIVLGQNVNSYGKDLEPPINLSLLLDMLCEIDGIERIRFLTSHPKDISEELMKVIASQKKICNHVHLPIQSGSTKVLREMNRGYTKEQYLEIIKKLKRFNPDIGLSTDIIVGFPGETEEDFQDTLDVLERVGFDSAFTFLYSARTGTPAAARPDQIPESLAMERFERLIEVQNSICKRKNDPLLGTIQSVLVESQSKSDKTLLSGRTETNKVVNFSGSKSLIGKIVNMKIDKVKSWSLDGSVVGGENT